MTPSVRFFPWSAFLRTVLLKWNQVPSKRRWLHLARWSVSFQIFARSLRCTNLLLLLIASRDILASWSLFAYFILWATFHDLSSVLANFAPFWSFFTWRLAATSFSASLPIFQYFLALESFLISVNVFLIL